MELPQLMQPQNIRTKIGDEAEKYLGLAGHWIVANVRQQVGWPEKSILVEFRGETLALLPEENQQYPAVALLKPNSMSDDEARTLIQHFLSSLAWAEGNPLSLENWSGGGRPYRMSRSNFGQLRRPKFQINYLPDSQDPRVRLALALYREGLGLKHHAYAFLSLYKIVNLVRSSGPDQKAWITNHLDRVWAREALERIETLTAAGEDVAKYLYVSGRCAIAHAGLNPTVDPENFEDARRLRLDFPLIKNLAEIAIEEEFGIQTPHTVWIEHKYELGGFQSLFGSGFVAKMKAKGSEFRRKVPALPRLTPRLRSHASYLPFEEMQPRLLRAADGMVTLQCVSASGRVSLLLGLDFPEERLRFDPIDGVSVVDDGTPEVAEEAAEIQRFLADYFANGQLEVWSGSDTLLGRCDPFIPINIDLGGTLENFREAEKKCREAAVNRRAIIVPQPHTAADRPQASSP